MFNNMSTSYMKFGYNAFMQSYPNTMHFSYAQVPQVDLTNFTPLSMNITPTEHPSKIDKSVFN